MKGWVKSGFVEDLSLELIQQIQRSGVTRKFKDNQLVHTRGDRERSMGIVEQGKVCLTNISLDGKQSVTGTLEPGDTFGEFTLFAEAPRISNAHAIGDTQIRYISRDEFMSMMDANTALRDSVLSMLARRLLFSLEMHDDARVLPMNVRLAKYLCYHLQGHSNTSCVEGTQSDMAVTLGVTRVTLGYAIKDLIELGFIRTAYRRIEILEFEKMQAWIADNSQLSQL